MKIKILGNGGGINDGLPYNSFLVDGAVLVEAPPDIMLSLHREGESPESIHQLFISHLHGDHCFGFPFLALDLLYRRRGAGLPVRMAVYLPDGGKEFLLDLTAKAFARDHPCVRWVEENMDFTGISNKPDIPLGGYTARLYRMNHLVETYGLLFLEGPRPVFAYIADTLWSDEVAAMLSRGPDVVLLDLNGEADDPVRVHLSEEDIIDKGLALAGPGTRFYGTHLKTQKKMRHRRIDYARPGMEIII